MAQYTLKRDITNKSLNAKILTVGLTEISAGNYDVNIARNVKDQTLTVLLNGKYRNNSLGYFDGKSVGMHAPYSPSLHGDGELFFKDESAFRGYFVKQ